MLIDTMVRDQTGNLSSPSIVNKALLVKVEGDRLSLSRCQVISARAFRLVLHCSLGTGRSKAG